MEANCLPQSFSFEYGINSYTATIKLNKFYPSLNSMFKVYLGVNDLSQINSLNTSVVKLKNVENVTLVFFF